MTSILDLMGHEGANVAAEIGGAVLQAACRADRRLLGIRNV